MKIHINFRNRLLPLAAAVLLLAANLLTIPPVFALTPQDTYIRLNRMATSTATSFRLQIKPATTTGTTTVAINFNGSDATTWTGAGGSIGAAASQGDITGNTCVADTGDTLLPGTHSFTLTGASSNILTITNVTALTAGVTYCDDLTYASAVTTPTSANVFHPTVTIGSDSTTVAIAVISNDQILVTAVVPPTFTFGLGANTDTFTSNLSSASVTSTGGVAATVTTNAKNGWIAWAKDLNTGLTSAAASKTIASTTPGTAATLSTAAEGYVLAVTSVAQGTGSAGTTSPITAYDGTASGGANSNGSGLDSTLRPIVSSTGTAGTSTGFTVKERASIIALTPAAPDYSDTITIIAAGRF